MRKFSKNLNRFPPLFSIVDTGAKFLPTNVMHLTFYADGIRLDEGRFRPYAERATKAFMKDLSDGFFPSELQVNYLLTYKYQNMVVGGFQKKWRIDSQSHIF